MQASLSYALLNSARRIVRADLRSSGGDSRDSKINLDLFKIADEDPQLYSSLLSSDPAEIEMLFRKAFNLERTEESSSASGVVSLSLTNLPTCPTTRMRLIEDDSLIKVEAVLLAKTAPMEYIRGTKFVCSRPDCASATEDNVADDCNLLMPEGEGAVADAGFCSRCTAPKMEDVRHRVVSQCAVANFCPCAAPGTALREPSEKVTLAIQVIVRDEDADALILGQCYELLGRSSSASVSFGAPRRPMLECVSLNALPDLKVRLSRNLFAAKETSLALPDEIRQSFKRLSTKSPWAFARWLAKNMCPEVVPEGTLVNIKMGLLLSLVSCSSTVTSLPVLIATDFPMLAIRLFHSALSLLDQSLVHRNNGGGLMHLAASGKSADVCGIPGAEAGSVSLASGGVCCLGDIDLYGKTDLESLKKVLEHKEIVFESPSTARGGKGSKKSAFGNVCQKLERQPLKSAVWAVLGMEKQSGRKKKSSLHTTTVNDSDAGFSNPNAFLIDVFGTVFLVDHQSDPDIQEIEAMAIYCAMTEHVGTEFAISRESWIRFLLQVIARPVLPMRDESTVLLKRYFVSSRRVRQLTSSSKGGAEIHISAMETMSVLAECHAKLSLRTYVMLSDVVAAIYLFESNLAAQYGYSYLVDLNKRTTVVSAASQGGGGWEGNDEADDDEEMRQFYLRLAKFNDDHAGDVGWEE